MIAWNSNKQWRAVDRVVGQGFWLDVDRRDGMIPVIVAEREGSIYIRRDNTAESPLTEPISGPFETLEAAQAAYLVLFGDRIDA